MARLGWRVSFTCAVLAGSPEPRLRWRKTGQNVVCGEGPRLVFEAVARAHGGTYICEADNGYQETSSVQLTVLCTLFSNTVFF